MNSSTGRAGVIRARDDAGNLDKLAHAVLDDVLYNVISDLLMKTHREEKTARATTAAIRVEKLASDVSDSSTPDSRPDVRVETDAAIYEDGKVLLKGNPLKTTQDILCPRCHLPRLLYPTDGKGAKKPDPAVTYCKKHPYIEKPGCDIYGQSWTGPGPGRGKKKKEAAEKKEPAAAAAASANASANAAANNSSSSTTAAAGAGAPEQRPPNVLSFPSATCSNCKRCILVTRLNNHMGSCIGNSGRNASRAAAQKINGGSGNGGGDRGGRGGGGGGGGGSQHDPASPLSSKATPTPASRAASPRKRDASDDDDDSENSSHRRKKIKPAVTKKVIIKTKPSIKKDKLKGSSLSQETKADYDSPGLASDKALLKKTKAAAAAADSPLKKLKVSKSAVNSPRPAKIPPSRDVDGESESSGTLSSPPATHH